MIDFLDEFEQYLQLLVSKGMPILVEDVNIHVEKTHDNNSQRFSDLLCGYNLLQMVPHALTHEEGGTLDLIIKSKTSELNYVFQHLLL